IPSPVQVALPVHAVAAAAGFGHTCVLGDDQSVYCFGWNVYGQLGRGDILDHYDAGKVGLEGVTAISATDVQTCALAGGQVHCWGYGGNGEIGNGTMSNVNVPTKVALPAGQDYAQVGVGASSACARSAAGEVFCWGLNSSGQLGTGDYVTAGVPVPVV